MRDEASVLEIQAGNLKFQYYVYSFLGMEKQVKANTHKINTNEAMQFNNIL